MAAIYKTLIGTVAPSNATNQAIVWSVKNPGTTGAVIAGTQLTATVAGQVVVTAVIANGAGQGLAFTRDFTITATGGSQIPGVPTSLSASPSGSGVSLAWNSVNGASYYRVYRSNSASGSYSQIGGSVYGASYTDSGLSAGTYYYKVSAISSSGIEGGQSGYVSAVVTATVPGAPTGLYTSVSENNVYLTWNSVGGASYYRVYRSNSAFGSYSQIGGSVYGASYTDSGLSAGT